MATLRPESEMKDSGIEWVGKVPVDWTVVPIRNCFDEVVEKNKDGLVKNALKFTYGEIVPKTNFDADDDDYVADTILNYYVVLPGTIMINGLNLNFDFISQRTGLVKEKGIITSAYLGIVPKDYNVTLPEFMNYLFKAYDYRMAFHNMGGGVRKILNFTRLKSQMVCYPSIIEQQAIADYLDDRCSKIDEIIAEAAASIEEYKTLKQAVIFETVTKGLDKNVPMKYSGYEFIGYIPASWDICKVRHIGNPQNGISFAGGAYGEGYPFVSYGDVYRNYSLPKQVKGLIQSSDDDRKRYSVQKGDIFFTRTSETKEEIGFSSVCEETITNAVFAGFLIRVRPFNDKMDTGFAKYYFRSNHLRAYFVKEMNLVIRASLGQELLKGAPVLLPPKEEQRKIAEYLDKNCALIDSTISEKENVITDLQAYKKSLIYETVTGKRRVV